MTSHLKAASIVIACAILIGAGANFALGSELSPTGGVAGTTQYEPKPGDQGCTPGFWKQVHENTWVTYQTTDLFDTVFGVDSEPGLTLLGALEDGGGGFAALARHATAALLNAANPNVNYGLTTSQIIAMVQKAFETGEPEQIKNEFAAFNEVTCSIDAHGN